MAVSKAPGESIQVAVSYTLGATQAGQPISWRYRLIVRMGRSTTVGWQDASELGTGIGVWSSIRIGSGLLIQNVTFQTPSDPGRTYDVRAALYGASIADPEGEPAVRLAEANLDGAFTITTPALAPLPAPLFEIGRTFLSGGFHWTITSRIWQDGYYYRLEGYEIINPSNTQAWWFSEQMLLQIGA